MTLSLSTLTRDQDNARYSPVIRFRATERFIRYVALSLRPENHTLLSSDCVTFARDYLTRTLDILRNVVDISPELYNEIRRNITQYVTSRGGVTGETEGASREDPDLGQSGADMIASHERMFIEMQERFLPLHLLTYTCYYVLIIKQKQS